MTAPTPPAPGAPASGNPSGQAPPATQPPATPPAPQQTGQAPATQQQGTPSMTLEQAQKVIDDLRKENAGHRTTNKEREQEAQAAKAQRDAVLKAMGLTPDGSDAPPDPEALAAQVSQQQAIAWETAAENAILRVAGDAGADADALLDSTTFLDSLEDFIQLDPRSAEFRKQLQAHITVWVDKHPKHKAAAAVSTATRSGGDHPGGTGSTTTRAKSLHAAIKAQLGQT